MNKKWTIALILFGVLLLSLLAAGLYFYNYAVVPAKKDFLGEGSPKDTEIRAQTKQWLADVPNQTEWYQTSEDGLKLAAIYLPAEKDQQKTVLLAHGYMADAKDMARYAKMYHELGYNVLMPDARGHGKSEGNYIGFGWDERKDYVQWIQKVLKKTPNEEIVLHGVSMGAATVMIVSGEKLPENVKAIVEDCGYTSANAELSYQLKQLFHLPPFPLIPVTSLVTKMRAGYFFGDVDVRKQLHKNKTPMLFIHGEKDDFVPFYMMDQLYDATSAPKEKYAVPGAKHAEAFSADPEKYQIVVSSFLQKYVK